MPLRYHEFLFLLFLLLAPESVASQVLTEGDIVGCYDIEVGEWDHPNPEELDNLRYHPPPRIEFTAVPFPSGVPGSSQFLVRPAPGSRASRHRFTGWGITGDSVRVVWSTGFIGIVTSLVQRGERLEGSAMTFSDIDGDPQYRADFLALRIPCESPPDFPFEEAQRVVRGVSLATGASVVLGEPLPNQQHISGKSSEFGYVFHAPVIGLFEGASLVKARAPRHGVVTEIRMDFPAETPIEPLIRELEELMDLSGRRDDLGGMPLISWEDTTTTLSIFRGKDRVRISLWDPRKG